MVAQPRQDSCITAMHLTGGTEETVIPPTLHNHVSAPTTALRPANWFTGFRVGVVCDVQLLTGRYLFVTGLFQVGEVKWDGERREAHRRNDEALRWGIVYADRAGTLLSLSTTSPAQSGPFPNINSQYQ